ncbi:3-hydroxyacyl-CoA dehydrogenase [Providencia stuartii]|uniref:3-hydroxyacyl-CoA dehydrogenase n=1 Tax=Providencia stuartii TaxID=588 RepID=UPI0028C20121|nr:3-hydroxyacyl-CoA dehydrogenase [Providencia stuartii]MDT7050788.1 3-hydroxyacyl-CoA dehydrogenase [Providencia stuartii]
MTLTLNTVAVIGAGTMGIGIAQVAASAGHTVLLFDINTQALNKAKQSLTERLNKRVQQGKADVQTTEALLARITLVHTMADLAPAQLVIEAVAEKLTIKQAIFSELEGICKENTLFASNTSSLSITAIASQLKHPERFAGLHFFNPAPIMKLVEVIRGRETASAVIEQLKNLAVAWGKIPVICRSTPGFIVNRVARPFYAETLRALEEQIANPATLDSVLRDAGGFSMGPLQLTDLIGHDVNYAVTDSVFQAFGYDPRFQTSFEQLELVQAGHLGRKTGRGFYHYDDNKPLPKATMAEKVILNNPPSVTARGDWQSLPEFAQLLRQNGIPLEESKIDSHELPTLRVNNVIVMLTNGELTSVRAQKANQSMVQFDLSADYAKANAIAISCAVQNSHQENQSVIAFFQSLNKDVIVLPDYPGLLTMRTVAMLCNEALDVVNKGVASPKDTDNAMRYGVNYPKGPLAWGAEIGWQHILNTLDQLSQFYADGRYRANPLLRQLVAGVRSLPAKELQ